MFHRLWLCIYPLLSKVSHPLLLFNGRKMEIHFTDGKVGQRDGWQLVPSPRGFAEARVNFCSLLSLGLWCRWSHLFRRCSSDLCEIFRDAVCIGDMLCMARAPPALLTVKLQAHPAFLPCFREGTTAVVGGCWSRPTPCPSLQSQSLEVIKAEGNNL